jgi:hypothetical protein
MVIIFALIYISFYLTRKKQGMLPVEMSKKDQVFMRLEIIMNCIWVALFIPILYFSFMAAVATFMITDSGEVLNYPISMALLSIDAMMFFGTPLVVVLCFILSFVFKKKRKIKVSFLIQTIPLVYIAAAFGILQLIFLSINIYQSR